MKQNFTVWQDGAEAFLSVIAGSRSGSRNFGIAFVG
jgi:hypothetical protein